MIQEIFICQNRHDKIKSIVGSWEKVCNLDNRLWTPPVLMGMNYVSPELDKRYLKAALKHIEGEK